VAAACAAAVGDWTETLSRTVRLQDHLAEQALLQPDSVVLLKGIALRARAAGQPDAEAAARALAEGIRAATAPR
jgi:hypothetical protein